MNVPLGDLLRSRVAPGAPGGHARPAADRLRPRAAGDDGVPGRRRVVLPFGDDLPVVAYHVDTDRGGGAALSAIATPGSYHVELYESSSGDLDPVHDVNELRVARGAPAEQVAHAPGLAERRRLAAPDDRDAGATDPVAAFLADEEHVEAIREQAREEAERRGYRGLRRLPEGVAVRPSGSPRRNDVRPPGHA